MSPDRLDQELTALLAQTEPIPDDGFSGRVLRALPPRRTGRAPRRLILLGMTAVGCLLGIVILPGGEFIHGVLARLPSAGWVRTLPVPWLLAFYVLSWMAVAAALEDRPARTRPSPHGASHSGPR